MDGTEQSIKWPHENEIYVGLGDGFVVIDCMGESLTFFTPSDWMPGQNKRVMDTYWFIAEFDEVSVP